MIRSPVLKRKQLWYTRRNMNRLMKRLGIASAPRFSALLAFLIVFCSLIYRLRSLTLDRSLYSERLTMQHAQTWHGIWHDIFNAPYFGLLRMLEYISHSVIVGRLLSISLALLASWLVYYVVHKWLGWKFAAIAMVLFGTNSYVLHTGRLADPYILQLLAGLSLLALFCSIYKKPSGGALVLWSISLPLLLYIPGTIWLVAVTLFASQSHLRSAWSESSKKLRLLISCLSTFATAPLIYFLVQTTLATGSFSNISKWLGVQAPSGPIVYIRQFLKLPVHLFWHTGTNQPIVSVANLPTIGLAVGVLTLLGLYIAAGRIYNQRWRLIVSLLVVSWFAAGLGRLNVAVTIPFLYVFAVVGLAYMLNEWHKVFPRNPLARGLGLGLVIIIVALSCSYNLRAYFVAWAHNPATVHEFSCPVSAHQPSSCTSGDFDIQ